MNIIISKQKLLKYLIYTENISSSKSTIPILSNVLIDAMEDKIYFSSSNLETGILIKDTANILENGASAVNGRKLLSIIKELPDDNVILTTDEHNRLTIKSESNKINAKFIIAGISKNDFPIIKTEPENEYIQINAKEFTKMIRKVIFSTSTDENKYSLTGIFLEMFNSNINMVASDGRRLSLITKEQEEIGIQAMEVIIPEGGVIIPKLILTEILKYTFIDDKLYLGFSKNQIFFMYDNINLTSNLIEGKFPDYKQIIPVNRENYFTTEKNLLLDAIRRVSLLADESYNQIKLSILKNKLLISSKNPTLGGAMEEIPINYTGEDIDIAINYVYLMDILKILDSDIVKIDFVNSEKSLTIKGEGEKDYINLIMPMKIDI